MRNYGRYLLSGGLMLVLLCPTTALGGGEASQRVFVDPRTGEFLPHPSEDLGGAAALPRSVEEEVFRSSDEGLVEEPGRSPAGGVKLDLKGRYRHAVTVQVDEQGRLQHDCVHDHSADR